MNTNERRSLIFGIVDMLKRLDAAIDSAHYMAGLSQYDPNSSEHKKIEKTLEKLKL